MNRAEPYDRSIYKLVLDGHDRPYYFDRVAEVHGSDSANRLMTFWAIAFKHTPGNTSYTIHRTLIKTIVEIDAAHRTNPSTEFQTLEEDLRNVAGPLDGAAWSSAVRRYLTQICPRWNRASQRQLRQQAEIAYALNSVLVAFEARQLCFGYERITNIRGASASKQAHPTLGELKRPHLPSDSGSLPNSLDDMAKQQIGLTRSRFEELKRCLMTDFVSHYKFWKDGQTYISKYSRLGAKSLHDFIYNLNLEELRRIYASKSPNYAEYLQDILERFVCLVHLSYNKSLIFGNMPSRYGKLCEWMGGPQFILRHLRPDNDTASLICAIIICETGFNVGTVSDLPADPFLGTSKNGKIRLSTIGARKRRAGGAPAFGIMRGQEQYISTSRQGSTLAIDAILMYQEMTQDIRVHARARGQDDVAGKLIIYPTHGGFKLDHFKNDTAWFAAEEWPKFLKRHKDNKIIGGLPVTRASLRATVLQLSYFDNDADVSIPQAIANHSSTDTTLNHYLNTSWMAESLQENIRQFQHHLEAALIQQLDFPANAHSALPVMPERARAAANAGISFYCSSRPLDVSQLARKGPSCTPLTPCESCPVRRLIPGPKAYRSLTLVSTALENARERLQKSNPKRWHAVWLPWLAVVTVYHRRLQASPFKFEYRREGLATIQALKMGQLALPEIF